MLDSRVGHETEDRAAPNPRIRAVVVLLRDRTADAEALRDGVAIAQRDNARLLVIVAPRLSRWLASCYQCSGIPSAEWISVEDQEEQAIDRCVAEALRAIPRDLPTTIRVVKAKRAAALTDAIAEFGDDWVGLGDRKRMLPASGFARRTLERRWKTAAPATFAAGAGPR